MILLYIVSFVFVFLANLKEGNHLMYICKERVLSKMEN